MIVLIPFNVLILKQVQNLFGAKMMKKLLFTGLFLLISTTLIFADWNEGEAAKWIQRPDLTGNGLAVYA
jgi:uncharacterized PurR-regulated membrane protein YhhQ (DUF165 family)